MIHLLDPKTAGQAAYWRRKARTNEAIVIAVKTCLAVTLAAVAIAVTPTAGPSSPARGTGV